ncbi:MAG: glycosyltransferase family 9 protein [Planctomycetota bacterium]|nr:glycosyltransferase family 9 protein [Planctomycetota bacterium]
MKHIITIHMGAIGDLVQAMPTLRAVRAKWPAARMLLVGRCERTALARMAGLVDDCVDFDVFSHAPPEAREADLVIDLFSAAMTKPSHAAGEVCLIDPLPRQGWTEPASAWLLRQAAARLGLPPVPETPEIPVPETLLDEARRRLSSCGISGPFAAIGAGSGSPKKNWPLDRFQEIARRLRRVTGGARGQEPYAFKAPDPLAPGAGRQVVWLSGPAEQERGTLAALGPDETVLADLSLEQVAAVLALADMYVGNDSGVTHIAAAVRRPDGRATPTVALFSPTNPQVWGPRGPHGRIVRSDDGAVGSIDVKRVWGEVRAMIS